MCTAALRLPCNEDEDYYCVTGLVDPRQDLHLEEGVLGNTSKLESDAGMKSMADVCVMASKMAYENEKVIKKAVEQEWKVLEVCASVLLNAPSYYTNYHYLCFFLSATGLAIV